MLFPLICRETAPVSLIDADLDSPVDYLNGLFKFLPEEGRAQDRVTVHDLLPCLLKNKDI